MKLTKTIGVGIAAFMLFFTTSCEEDKNNTTPDQNGGTATLKINLTDAPANYDAVKIDIQEVHVKVNGNDTLLQAINPGVYDLLKLRNGLDTLLAQAEVPAGKISQIRLILGTNNTVVVDSSSTPLKTPSGQQSGIKLQVNYTLEEGLAYDFYLDFDAQRSVVEKGNGGYNLKPVIRVFTENTTGSIEGHITPAASYPTVIAYNTAGDTATTRANQNSGYYLIKGLKPGTYTVDFDPVNPYIPEDTSGISVSSGSVTNLDTTVISQ